MSFKITETTTADGSLAMVIETVASMARTRVTELLDVAVRPVRVGDFVIYTRQGATLGFAKVLEVCPDGRPVRGFEFRLRLQGLKLGYAPYVQRPAWLNRRISPTILRLELCQIPEQARVLLGSPPAGPVALADLEREQAAIVKRLTEIDGEMERIRALPPRPRDQAPGSDAP